MKSYSFMVAVLVCLTSHTAWCQMNEFDNASIFEDLRTFADVLSMVEKEYVDQCDPRALLYDAMQGMVSRLDPHSAFLPPKRYQEMQVETRGTFGGLGLEVTVQDDLLTVVAPIEDTPADRAGIRSGDRIVAIEGRSTRGMDLEQAVKLMRGPPGSEIAITISRPGVEGPLPFTITRAVITIRSVRSRPLPDNLGYIRIAMFQEHTAEECIAAIGDLQPIQGLVLDLRDNPGGLLTEAVAVADLFLDNGTIVSTRGRDAQQRGVYRATADAPAVSIPLVVLVNAGTASGSEIVAGALQDYGLGVVVGQPTFGKGTVQTVFPLRDGSGLRLTTSRYYTPANRSIQERGIVPDIVVDPHQQTDAAQQRTYLRERDLTNHLPNTQKFSPSGGESGDTDAAADNQLQTAVAILKGITILR